MSDLTPSNALQQLLDLEIITSSQRDLALGHTRAAELDTLTNISEVLFWLITRDIFPEEDFMQFVQTEAQNAWLGTEKDRQRLPIISATHAMLQQLKKGLNLSTLEQLLNDKLITTSQHELAQANVSEDEVFGTPEQALAWMIMMGFITQQELALLRASLQSDSAFAGNASKIQTLAGAEALVNTIETAMHKANVRAFWGEVFPGPGWMWIGGAVLAVVGFFWYALTPTEPPSCTSSDTRKTLDNMIFRSQLDANISQQSLLHPEERHHDYVSITNIQNVGYAKVDKIRGCLATLKSGDDETPYAFTIGPKPVAEGEKSNPDEFLVIGADPDIVKARFSNISADGNYAQQAAPIGRVNLEKAFRAGAASLSADGSASAMARAMQQLQPQKSGLSETDANREREIAEVEPIGACQPIEAGKRYRCPLMIERNDPLLAAIGRDSNTVIKSDFTFEQDPSSKTWKVSDNFAKEYVESITKGRLGLLKETESSDGNEAPPAASAVSQ